MYEKLFTLYTDMGSVASARSDALTARASFVSGVMQQTYQLWMALLTTEVTEAVKAAQELAACRTPGEVNDVQREWVTASFTRAITSLQGTVAIANLLIGELSTVMAVVQASQPGAGGSAAAKKGPSPVTQALSAPQVAQVAQAAAVPVMTAAPAEAAGSGGEGGKLRAAAVKGNSRGPRPKAAKDGAGRDTADKEAE